MTESSSALVNLQDITVTKGGTDILRDVSWRIEPGQHWALIGPNGAGKSTVARVIAGQESVSDGIAEVLGTPLAEHDRLALASQVGLASADLGSRLPGHMTARQVVSTAAWGQTVGYTEEYEDEDAQRAEDLLAALGVSDAAERLFSTLSEGERRRVLLARSLMPNPEIVILDEPTAGLDLGGREILLQAIDEIMADSNAPSLIMITHEPEQIAAGFTHALILSDGTVHSAGPLSEVISSQALSEVFGIPLEVSLTDGRINARAKRED